MDQQSIQLRADRGMALGRLASRGVHGDHHVAQQAHRRAARAFGLREGQHVGRAVDATPLEVQPVHDGIRHEQHRQLRVGTPQEDQQSTGAPAEARGDGGNAPPPDRDRHGGPPRLTGARRQ